MGPENLDGVALTFEDGSELFIPACDLVCSLYTPFLRTPYYELTLADGVEL